MFSRFPLRARLPERPFFAARPAARRTPPALLLLSPLAWLAARVLLHRAPATPPPVRRFAVLIDADNAQPTLLEDVLAAVETYGVASIRRIYGDWSRQQLNGWTGPMRAHALLPVQVANSTAGKNATDIALVIDAMDILSSGAVDGFCIVSSDGDYSRLVLRLRQAGQFVVGIGKMSTPMAFVATCQAFVFVEDLPTAAAAYQNGRGALMDVRVLLRRAYADTVERDGWANISLMGTRLHQLKPGFKPQTYGHGQLWKLVQAHSDLFEIRRDSASSKIFARLRKPAAETAADAPSDLP
jgi:hypothetical protein